jgi:hypothetical protein
MYALMMSVINGGSMVGNYLGAGLMWGFNIKKENMENLWILIIIQCVWMLLMIFLVKKIEVSKAQDMANRIA